MADWCESHICISFEKKEHYEEVSGKLYNQEPKEFFSLFITPPNNIKNEELMDWCITNWGTKWEPYNLDVSEYENTLSIDITLQTAWNPPSIFCEKFAQLYPCQVELTYYEPITETYSSLTNY